VKHAVGITTTTHFVISTIHSLWLTHKIATMNMCSSYYMADSYKNVYLNQKYECA